MTDDLRIQLALAEIQQDLALANAHIQWMETSKFWKLRALWCRVRNKLKKVHRRSVRLADPEFKETLLSPFSSDYIVWQHRNTPRSTDLKRLAEAVDIFPLKPVISIIVPVYNPPRQFLEEAIESILSQIYPYWELCLADDASSLPYVREVLEHYQSKDSRIKVVFREQNGHISNCSNSALEIATGEYVALVDHDDLLTPDALYEMALCINRHPEADMIYSDEDKVDTKGVLSAPYFKPDWCPDSFLCRMYICHLGIYRRSILQEIGGFRIGYEGSQDYDLVLRLTEKTQNIFHIPKILYHWRIHPESAASGSEAKPYAYDAAERAIADALDRRGEPGIVSSMPQSLGSYTIRYHIQDFKLVSVILTPSNLDALDRCLKAIFLKTDYPNYEVIVIANPEQVEPKQLKILDFWKNQQPDRFRLIPFQETENHSKANNYAAQQANGDYLLFLSEDIEIKQSDWVRGLVEQAQRESIGAAGVKLAYPDERIHHAGILIGVGGSFGYAHHNFPSNSGGYFNHMGTVNNYAGVSGGCLICRRSRFEEVNGFDEELCQEYNAVDLCLKFLERGYRNVYLSYIKSYIHLTKSQQQSSYPTSSDRQQESDRLFRERWNAWTDQDVYYNPNLTKDILDFSLKI